MHANLANRRPRQLDIAREAGVSISTVSRVLANEPGISEAVRQQILKVATDLGYRVRTGLTPSAPPPAVALLTADQATGGLGLFYEGLLAGLRGAYAEHGVTLKTRLVGGGGLSPQGLEQTMASAGAQGVYMIGLDPGPDVAAWLLGEGRAAVLVNGADPAMRFDCVSPANFYGARIATGALLDAGHRRLVHFTHDHRPTIRERTRGYLASVADCAGARGQVIAIGHHSDARAAMARLIEEERRSGVRSTGVFCMNDMIAVGVLEALADAGLSTPDDVSVVGFDDLPCAEMTAPRLTTLHVDRGEIGREAFRQMQLRLTDPDAPARRVELGVHLVEGGTVSQLAMAGAQ